MGDDLLDRVRSITLALPEVDERFSHGAPSFVVGGRRPICYFHDAGFSGDGRVSIWCPAVPGVQDELVAADSVRYFAPTPSASGVFRDWVGAYVDDVSGPVDWIDIAGMIEDAYRTVAPKRLIARLDGR